MKNTIISLLLAIPLLGFGQNPLFIPDTLGGASIDLNFVSGTTELYDGFMTNTVGYNQSFLGPTLLLQQGNEVTMNVTNSLAETTTLHWHGLHVAPENDGGPHTAIEPGEVWSPAFTVLDKAATYWYHPHLHEHTEEQVTKGGAGFIIVKDDEEAQLDLPRTYGIDDFPILIQSKAFDSNKQIMTNTAQDNILLVNGTIDAFLAVPAQVIRLRLLNGSTERVYNLGLENNLEFKQITSDGGLLNIPVALTRLKLAPGERAEILVNLSNQEGASINLMSFASELPSGNYGAANPSVMPQGSITGYNNNELNGSNFNIVELQVGTSTINPILTIPNSLTTNIPYPESTATTTRSLTFRPVQMGPTGMVNGPFDINDAAFNMTVINQEVPLGNTEIWELTNFTAIAHPFHIHDVQFFILDINGATPPANLQGRKDVVLVPPMGGSIRFITKFEDFANEEIPYMYHCHMLSHEDAGMMGQFVVFDDQTNIDENQEFPILIYPNPTADVVLLKGLNSSVIKIYNATGQLLDYRATTAENEQFSLKNYANGVYYFDITSGKQHRTIKILKD